MKKYITLFFVVGMLAACAEADPSPNRSAPSAKPQVTLPSPTQESETVMAAIGFQVGTSTHVSAHWLKPTGIVYRTESAIEVDPAFDGTVQLWLTAPPLLPELDAKLMQARYGCNFPESGDEFFSDASMSEVKPKLVEGKEFLSATFEGLKGAFFTCRGLPVAIAVEFYNQKMKLDAKVVVYLTHPGMRRSIEVRN